MTQQHLIGLLDEQILLKFTGKLNILKADNRQHLGVIHLVEGEIVHCTYHGKHGINALIHAYMDHFFENCHSYVVEPEIISRSGRGIPLSFKTIKAKLAHLVSEYEKYRAHRPPAGLELYPRADFVRGGEQIGASEFSVLLTLCDYPRVQELYEHSPLLEYEITRALVALRKKMALRVVKGQAS